MNALTITLIAFAVAACGSIILAGALRRRPFWLEPVIVTRLGAALLGFALGTFIATGLYLGGSAVDDAASARTKLEAQDRDLARAIDRVSKLEDPTTAQIRALIDRFLSEASAAQRRRAVDLVKDVIRGRQDTPRANGQSAPRAGTELRGGTPPRTGPVPRPRQPGGLIPPVVRPVIPPLPPVKVPELPPVDLTPFEPLLPPVLNIPPMLDLTDTVRAVLDLLGVPPAPK